VGRRTILSAAGSIVLIAALRSPLSHAMQPVMSPSRTRTPADKALARRVKAISNVFEVGKVTPDYSYVEDLGDGRGLTLTQYGLVTNELEVGWVIQKHQNRRPDTKLARFLPALPPHGAGTDALALSGFADIWRVEIAEGSSLREACDEVADNLYFEPALAAAEIAGVTTPVGVLIFYDTYLQHGGGDDPDSFGAILGRAQAGGATDDSGSPETDFLKRFLEVRRSVLMDPHNAETAEVWRRSVTRVDALETLLKRNPFLRPPVIVANSEIRVRVS
jgi:chitosanase